MIGESGVHAGEFNLGHVASDTTVRSDRTSRRTALGRLHIFRRSEMTGKAL